MRALVVRADGVVAGRAARPLPTRFPSPGRVEQDPAQMWRLSQDVLREAMARAGIAASGLAALGVVTQRGTTVAWDAESLAPLAPAIGWQDRRAAERAADLAKEGVPIHSLASATKLEWWLRNEPAVSAAAAGRRLRFGTPDAWLTQQLTGGAAFVSDASQASCTGLYELRGGTWSARLLARLTLDEAWLPRLVATNAVVGETPRSLLGSPVPVAARAGDQQAASFGQGVLSPGEGKLTLGTAAMLDRHAGETLTVPPTGSYPLVLWELVGGKRVYCMEGTVITAGAAVDWLVEMGLLSSPDALDTVASRVPDAAGASFVPALQGLGTPWFADAARGSIGGLTRGTTPAHLARALIEGLAQRCADVCEALGPFDGALRVDGGLARSDLLLQTLSNLSGLVLERAAESETTALGAAFLAALGVGLMDRAEAVRGILPAPDRFSPAMAAEARRGHRARWRALLERIS